MTSGFGETTTASEILSGIDLTGRRLLVTGALEGLGLEMARALVAHGAQVVGAVLTNADSKAGIDAIRAAATHGGLELVNLDLASLESVRECAGRLRADGRKFDLVISNAGVMATPQGTTTDGFETQLGINHLGHFVLVNQIASLIRPGGRLVAISSVFHRLADFDFDDPNFLRSAYDPWIGYARSKTAIIQATIEFDRRHREAGVRAVIVHPGAIQTGLGRYMTPETRDGLTEVIRDSYPEGSPPLRYKSVAEGAATALWAGIVAPADAVGGRYCEDCQIAKISSGATIRDGVQPYAIDRERAKALWTKSEEMVGEQF
jgi:NAD(P)-dependent dehydrogenase (short-subunit alcohol dehydrogenase family)